MRRPHDLRLHFGALGCAGVLVLSLGLPVLVQTASAKTYTVTDGEQTMTYTTSATDPQEVLDALGWELGEHDSYTAEAGNTITVKRAETLTLSYHGEVSIHPIQEQTVAEFLEGQGIVLGEHDRISCDLEQPLSDDMVIRIDETIIRREEYTVSVPYQEYRYPDADLKKGEERCLIEGAVGEAVHTADVTYVNGQETMRLLRSEEITRKPVTEMVGYGVAEGEASRQGLVITDDSIILPNGEVLHYKKKDTVRATAYTHTDAGCNMTTATGTTVRRGTVAVDPRFIPYGTKMFIVTSSGEFVYGLATAEDCGGDIKRDRMDLYFPTYEECIQFGRQRCTLYFLT